MNARLLLLLTLSFVASGGTSAGEFEGLLDLRLVAADSDDTWLHDGLDKQRFDGGDAPLRLGQAVLVWRGQPLDTVSTTVVANAYSDRDHGVDISEAYVSWKPLPTGPWRWRTRIGAFFPTLSFENGATGWTSPYMLSTSAINTWVGEELRSIGAELSLERPGRFVNSPHDFDLTAGVFGWNDAAGGLITWRGWSIGDRVTGLSERLPLPDLAVYAPGGAFASQVQWEEPFHELDNRAGYYLSAEYGFRNQLRLRAMHYDNHGDPFEFSGGQWAWTTRFQAYGASWQPRRDWELLAQYLDGDTRFLLRRYGVLAEYRAWFLLLSRQIGRHRISVRFDNFSVKDGDQLSVDDNSESGDAWALAYLIRPDARFDLGLEWLRIASDRGARRSLNLDKSIVEQQLQLTLRWHF